MIRTPTGHNRNRRDHKVGGFSLIIAASPGRRSAENRTGVADFSGNNNVIAGKGIKVASRIGGDVGRLEIPVGEEVRAGEVLVGETNVVAVAVGPGVVDGVWVTAEEGVIVPDDVGESVALVRGVSEGVEVTEIVTVSVIVSVGVET